MHRIPHTTNSEEWLSAITPGLTNQATNRLICAEADAKLIRPAPTCSPCDPEGEGTTAGTTSPPPLNTTKSGEGTLFLGPCQHSDWAPPRATITLPNTTSLSPEETGPVTLPTDKPEGKLSRGEVGTRATKGEEADTETERHTIRHIGAPCTQCWIPSYGPPKRTDTQNMRPYFTHTPAAPTLGHYVL
ncbi:hypothetical protein B9Z19DRAFT_1130027 [Tuber borchii]|uniref:Uncharacterized protein n=1 Tax=Tuber borchii TaxID=42251 RepID=A0A2T6ZLB7_TUBBO|nr:hypothetical protein B9Z19DRAFT_1130027 [Tuber borchii]